MKVFTSQGIEKDDNADVLVRLDAVNNVLNSSKTLQELTARQMQIMNLHLAVLNDQFIEEPP
jgi:hypothetical protein